MKALFFLLLMTISASAQTLNDQFVLSSDLTFIQRVRQSMLLAAINVSSDGLSGGINTKRHTLAGQIMNSPDAYKSSFAQGVATQPSAINLATNNGAVTLVPNGCTPQATAPFPACTGGSPTGNAAAQAALVTDAVINNSVLFIYNSFFGGQ